MDSAIWAARGIWLGVVTAILLAITLFYTKRAAEAAERVLGDLERPWLYLESVGFKRREFTGTAWDKSGEIVPYAYWIDITFRNAGRMLGEVTAIEFVVIEKARLTAAPDYSGKFLPLNFERKFIQPGKTGKTGQFGIPIPEFNDDPAYVPPQLVIYGRIKYKGLTSTGHETGFSIEPWFIGGAWVTYGGSAYNWHK